MATKTKHRGMIGKLTVASNCDYVVYGSVRGLVSQHRLLRAAQSAAQQDRSDCRSLGGGAYSDVAVYCWDDEDGWCLDVTADE
ncbi:MAG: hypothetical protein WCH39_04820 [Schlesneria sp.]